MAGLLVWCLTFAPETGSRCDLGHNVEKALEIFMAKVKDRPKRPKRFPVGIIRFNERCSRTHGRRAFLEVDDETSDPESGG
jgi:hypothetical protein